ncbi:hypothetical protein N7465_001827 [Penicillium sp. CMV-2018d]|nr:hypothetical protein N7465_001827 [Penicillium sp. CMV-2018d]
MGLKQKANKDKVGDRPIPALTTAQLEILTQLRLQAKNRVYARRRLLQEASLIMQSVNAIMVSYANNDEAPSMDTLWRLEERMI